MDISQARGLVSTTIAGTALQWPRLRSVDQSRSPVAGLHAEVE